VRVVNVVDLRRRDSGAGTASLPQQLPDTEESQQKAA
jgi:hypothetical protein